MLEQQFISFLIDRIEAKVGELPTEVSSTAEEIQLYVSQLKTVVAQVYDTEPVAKVSARRSRRGTSRNESGDVS